MQRESSGWSDRDVARGLADVLRDEAKAHHEYRRESSTEAIGGHEGSFAECATLRCQRVREVLSWAQGATSTAPVR